ncbi:MAG: tyrosine-type recombinase/integrase [Erysipelotrichaceae bacterium]
MPKISNIYQDKKSNRWYFVANLGYDSNGNRLRHWGRGFPSQKEAKSAYDDYMNNFSKTSIKMNSTMSYEEFFYKYFEPDYKRSVKKSTYENRISSMEKHFKFFYKRKLKDIKAPLIKEWQNKLSETYSSAYIRLIFGMFQMSLDLAVKLELLQTNIAKKVGNVKKEKKTVDFWTKEEFEKVITTFNINNYYEHYAFTTIWFLFMTGLRIGEARAITWNDIDFNNNSVSITKSMYYKNVKEFYINPPKTKAGIRTLALDTDTIRILTHWKSVQNKNITTDFVLSYNELPTNKSTLRRILQKHSKLAEVHDIKIHALRHSHASLLISMGENALIIKDRLGHEDVETTLGTYGHLYPNMNREVATKLSNLIKIKK